MKKKRGIQVLILLVAVFSLAGLTILQQKGKIQKPTFSLPRIQTSGKIEKSQKERQEKRSMELRQMTGEVMQTVNYAKTEEPQDAYRTYYEVSIASFADGNGDGKGDLNGLIHKLDYLNDGNGETTEDLGVTGLFLPSVMQAEPNAIWNIIDYNTLDASYGTQKDWEKLISESHKRGMRVMMGFNFFYTSKKHPWFQEACVYLENHGDIPIRQEECIYLNYYHFTKKPKGEFYHRVGKSQWFYQAYPNTNEPALNWEKEEIRESLKESISFWLDTGVDAFFVPNLSQAGVEQEKGLRWFADFVHAQQPECFLVADAGETGEKEAALYECGVDSVCSGVYAGSRGTIASVLNGRYGSNAGNYAYRILQRKENRLNGKSHGIDTLYYTNGEKGRSTSFYNKDKEAKTKLAGAMQLMLGGTSFLYYGEEIGMDGTGSWQHRHAPMRWSKDWNASEMCKPLFQNEKEDSSFASVEEQIEDNTSILNFYRQAILLRNRYPEIARGEVSYLEQASNEAVCILQKEYNSSRILLAFNLSDVSQSIETKQIQTYGYDPARLVTGGVLLTGESCVKLGEKLTLPPYSMVLLYSEGW